MAQLIDPYANPAFLATMLHWACNGHERARKRVKATPYGMNPAIAMVAASAFASPQIEADIPTGGKAKLENFATRLEEWILSNDQLTRIWRAPFWEAVQYGAATSILKVEDGRLCTGGEAPRTETEAQEGARKRAASLGRLIGAEGTDRMAWTAIWRGCRGGSA